MLRSSPEFMNTPFIDTDVIIRFLTGDDPKKQARATILLKKVEDGKLILEAPDTVIADTIYVLASPKLYAKSRTEIRAYLTPIISLPGFHIQNKRVLMRAVEIYSNTNKDFGDAMLVATMEQHKSTRLYSYDRGFEAFSNITRVEP